MSVRFLNRLTDEVIFDLIEEIFEEELERKKVERSVNYFNVYFGDMIVGITDFDCDYFEDGTWPTLLFEKFGNEYAIAFFKCHFGIKEEEWVLNS